LIVLVEAPLVGGAQPEDPGARGIADRTLFLLTLIVGGLAAAVHDGAGGPTRRC